MKIKKVDDRPMVLHTKQKAKLHVHKPRQASIKGSNVYSVNRSPRIKSGSVMRAKTATYRTASERIKAKARSQYRKSTIHSIDSESVRRAGIGRFRRAIQDSKSSIKTKQTNLHIAEVAIASSATEQLDGGKEVEQAAGIAYEVSRPVTDTASKGADLFRRKAIANRQRKIKQVQAGGKLAKHSIRNATSHIVKDPSTKAGREGAKLAAKTGVKTAAATAETVAGPEGAVVGYAAGQKLAQMEYKTMQRNRKIRYFLDKMKAEGEQTDSLPKLMKDLVTRKAAMWIRSAAPALGIAFASVLLIVFVAVIPAVTVTTVLYNSPFAVLLPTLEEGDTVISVATAYFNDFKAEVQRIADEHTGCDEGELVYVNYEGTDPNPSNLYDIIAVYMVKHGVGESATIINDTTKGWIKEIVDDMCTYTTKVKTKDGKKTLVVKVRLKTYRDMITEYGFDEDETAMLQELMSPDNLEAMGYTGFDSDTGGNPAKCSLTEEEISEILKGISDSTQKKVVSYALHRVGYPYSQDLRDTGEYYDCSSLAYYSWKSAGVDISHAGATTAAEEARGLDQVGKTVSFSEMQPGDLIFYSYANNGRYKNISHVAIYVGNGKLVEAQNEKNGVVFRDAKNSGSIVLIGRPKK